MPILDSKLRVFNAVAHSGTGAKNSTSIDFGPSINSNLGVTSGDIEGKPLAFVVNTSAVTGTSPTVVYSIEDSADDSSFASIASFPSKTLAAGVDEQLPLPRVHRRYVRLVATLGGTTPACTMSSWLVDGFQLHSK